MTQSIQDGNQGFRARLHTGIKDKGRMIHKGSISVDQYLTRNYIHSLIFIGALGILAFFVALIFFKSRKSVYFYYTLFLIACMALSYFDSMSYSLNESGRFFIDPKAYLGIETMTLVGLAAYSFFSISLLEIATQNKKLVFWIRIVGILSLTLALFNFIAYPFSYEHRKVILMLSRALIVPMSILALWGIISRVNSEYKKLFLWGSIFYLLGAIIGLFRESVDAIPWAWFYNFNPGFYFHCGIFLEVICFTIALSQRIFIFSKFKQENEISLRKALTQERDTAEAEVLVSRLKTSPHFIFNGLSAIKYFIQINEKEKAIHTLTHYSSFIRAALATGSREEITLKEELDILRSYLFSFSDRFNQKISLELQLDSNIQLDHLFLPPLLLLPYTESILKYILSQENQQAITLFASLKPTSNSKILLISNHPTNEIIDFEAHLTNNLKKTTNKRIKLYNKDGYIKITPYISPTNENMIKEVGLKFWDQENS